MIDLIAQGGMPPESQKELSEAFTSVRHYYAIAEEKMKLLEGIDGELFIPSVNELRYAGCHLSKSTVATDFETIKGELGKAKKHCKRAIYDALEVGITYYLERLRVFQEDYKTVVLSPIISDLSVIQAKIVEIRDFVAKPRGDDRADFWEGCTQYFYEIQQLSDKIENCREDLNKVLLQQAHDQRQYTHKLILRYVGIFVAVIALGYTVYMQNQPASVAPSSQKTIPQEAHAAEPGSTK